MRRTIFLLAMLLAPLFRAQAENIVFPRNRSGIVDITLPPYNADKTGKTDATKAINDAFAATNAWRTIYFPNGTYTVSNTLSFPTCVSLGCNGVTIGATGPIVQGQSRKGTVIRLLDGTFTNAASPRPVLYTGEGVAQNFNRNVHNITINVGRNNPGATGVYFYSNNLGLMAQVDIISEDGQGAVGLDLGTGEQGPCMVSEIYIRGFRTGIRNNALNLVTCSRITLEGQTLYGLNNESLYLAVDSLTSANSVAAVRNAGDLTLVNARLIGGSAGVAAIQNSGQLFARGVTTQGYQRALSSTRGTNVSAGASFQEFSTALAQSLFPSPAVSMNLPVRYPPDPGWDDTILWANALIYKGGVGTITLSDAQALQKALDDTAKTIVLLPFAKQFSINDTIYVRGRTKRIVGTSGSISGTGAIVVLDAPGAAPVVKFEKIGSVPIIQRCSRTVVVESFRGRVFALGSGDLFVTDITTHGDLLSMLVCTNPSARVWTWQFDAECGRYAADYYGLEVSAGRVWVFGWKSEGKGMKLRATGGIVEILGFQQYNNSWNTGMSGVPMFTISNTQFSLGGMSQLNFNYEYFSTLVRETRGGVTKDFNRTQNPGGYSLPLYTGYDSSQVLSIATAPRIAPVGKTVGTSMIGRVLRITGANGGSETPSAMLLDARGRTVRSARPSAGELMFDATALPAGVYQLIVRHSGMRESRAVALYR